MDNDLDAFSRALIAAAIALAILFTCVAVAGRLAFGPYDEAPPSRQVRAG